jgi:hypothetical protein
MATMEFRAGFGSFDGIRRRCLRYKQVLARTGGGSSHRALRCVKFARGKGKPACNTQKVGGGRSPGLINHTTCRRRRAR